MNNQWSRRWLGPVTLRELAAKTWNETNEDNVFGRAAELAFYFLLALFPMLIFLTSLVGFLPGVREAIFTALAKFVPGEAMRLVSETIYDVTRNRSGGLLSFGVLGALWAASGGVSAVMGTLNVAYDAKEERPFWKTRLIAIGLTILLALLIVGGTTLIMFRRPLRFLGRREARNGNDIRRHLERRPLSVGRDAALFGFGADLLLGAERQTGLEVDHTGRSLRRCQPACRLAALLALLAVRAQL